MACIVPKFFLKPKLFLWIGITYATFSLSGNTPVVNDILKMIEGCSNISSSSNFRILTGLLFGPADFLGLKFEIILIVPSFAQGESFLSLG